MISFNEHPSRPALAAEVHARPFLLLQAPVKVSYLAAVSGERGAAADHAHLSLLCARQGVAPPAPGATHFAGDLGPFRLKWERHTEFSSYTFVRDGPFADPFAEPAAGWVPQDWMAAIPGPILAAIHLGVAPGGAIAPSLDELGQIFDRAALAGSSLMGGLARAWTDVRIHADGFARILVHDNGLDARGTGRLVQRLLELETYRLAAMLAFPLARDALPRVAEAERALGEVVARLPEISGVDEERQLLQRLSELAARAEAVSAATSYRFGAARAYYALVRQRMEELREERLRHLQPLAQFLLRRLAPAMATCESVDAREEALSRRIARASDLLRTRVDVALEEQNRDLLRSMDRRARLQLRLQQTVEGLSVVVVSYYLIGLLGYLVKGAKAAGVAVDPEIAPALALPFVVALVWVAMRRLRRAIFDREDRR
jgi:uncharacterized membrane-anchored protein